MATGKRYIGLDLGKRSMEVAMVWDEKNKIERRSYKTTSQDKVRFIERLKETDIIGLETGNSAFYLAKMILDKVGCKVHILNAGKLHVIFESMKKTDKEDAVRIAKFIQRTPEEELPTVKLPSDEELHQRSSVTEQERISRMRTKSINALHNLFWNQGLTDLKRKDFHNAQLRRDNVPLLPKNYRIQAQRLIEQIELFENQLKSIEQEQLEMLASNKEESAIIMSIPGMGPKTTLAIQAYLGKMDRFSSGRQVAYFVGLVPRIDRSGQQNHYGSITKQGPKQVRRLLNQAAWAAIRSKDGINFTRFFLSIKARRGTRRAIVAVARKMLEILFAMFRSNTLYNPGEAAENRVKRKFKMYKIIPA